MDINNETSKEKGRKRIRKITWFNPPYSTNVATNIGKKFFSLISTCFPADNKLKSIINKNTIKLSYSCMPNLKQIINNHNKSILNKQDNKNKEQLCNCRDKSKCPLDGDCLQEGLVYQATVTQGNTRQQDTYVGITENQFKTRYNQHNSSFKLAHKRHETRLSEHIWKLKEKNIDHTISWSVISKANPFSPASKRCSLCLEECYHILKLKPTLNKRKEIYSTCPHFKKHLLLNTKAGCASTGQLNGKTGRTSTGIGKKQQGTWRMATATKHRVVSYNV